MIKLVIMNKFILLISIMFFSYNSNATEGNFYDFNIKSISGEKINLSDYKNKVVLLVNTASQCGFTPQYSGLQKIYDTKGILWCWRSIR